MAIFGPILATIGTVVGGWFERRGRIAEAKANAEIEREKRLAQVTADYDIEALRASQSSWKDEFWTVIFGVIVAAPVVAVFLGYDISDKLRELWAIYAGFPEWFVWTFQGIIAATFGLRGFRMVFTSLKK